MKNINEAWLIQIEVTRQCVNSCAYCTRAVAHSKKQTYSSLDFIEKALQSLKGWKKGVGCMGGEPTLHPYFEQICFLYRKYFPKRQCGLWTSGGYGYEKHRKLIKKTFGIVHYNDHTIDGYHKPMMIASREVVPDRQLRNNLIDNCWVQINWSPTITEKGAFFCEVASTFDYLFDGPGGYSIEPGWWNKTPEQFADQRDNFCGDCGMALPINAISSSSDYEYVTAQNAEKLRLKGSPLYFQGRVKIYDQVISTENLNYKDKHPENYLDPTLRPLFFFHQFLTFSTSTKLLFTYIECKRYLKLVLNKILR